jgi:hypothetical protein
MNTISWTTTLAPTAATIAAATAASATGPRKNSPGGLDLQPFEHHAEDRLVRLRLPVRPGRDRRVDVEMVVRHERIEVAARVRHEPELQPVRAQPFEHGKRVLVELEVLGVLPRPRHLDGAVVRRVGVAAHAAHDPLRKRNPDGFVVFELGMVLEIDQGSDTRLVVPRRIERQPEALAEALVALGPELGPGARDREIHVEEDGAQHHAASSSHCAVFRWFSRQ